MHFTFDILRFIANSLENLGLVLGRDLPTVLTMCDQDFEDPISILATMSRPYLVMLAWTQTQFWPRLGLKLLHRPNSILGSDLDSYDLLEDCFMFMVNRWMDIRMIIVLTLKKIMRPRTKEVMKTWESETNMSVARSRWLTSIVNRFMWYYYIILCRQSYCLTKSHCCYRRTTCKPMNIWIRSTTR